MSRRVTSLSILVLALAAVAAAADQPAPVVDPASFKALHFRCIGPYRGGRVTAVTGVAGHPGLFYMGSTGGGVWKTTDGGLRWDNVTDGQIATAAVGAVAVAPSDPNVVYVGMGSTAVRGNVSTGDGVYRSTDAGSTWTHLGLESAGMIGRVRVHPTDPDTAWVAALGNLFAPNEERGVFRTTDGGETWRKVLFVSRDAGAVDLVLDPSNPRILYAATWQVRRTPWTLDSGGEGSGLYRSTDGGDTWTELTEGLPEGVKGRIGVAVSPARSGRVWALVEAEDGGLYRSDDGGAHFRLVTSDRNLLQRAWYYTRVYADPADPETVWVVNVSLWRSVDGGASFEPVRAPHGDHHDLWIDPDDPDVMINGNDGGANVTGNGGGSWTNQGNQPTAEMYRVTVDEEFPYRVYGCQQDNTCVVIPSRTTGGGIARHDWDVIGGCESGHVAVDPRDPDVTYAGCYGGSITRFDRATGEEREIMAYPELAVGQAARDLRYRFQWNAPIRISPHDPTVLYHTSQYVHRSIDEGASWQVVSPDLTRDEDARQGPSGGPLTRDNTGVEVYDTIFAFEESPLTPGVLWAGSDDGLVHVSRDGGTTWTDVTPKAMPEWGTVNAIELSRRDPERAYLAVHRYRLGDDRPYVFRTEDFGASWRLLTDGSDGIPADDFVRVVREDPVEPDVLYAGTERGLYLSFDAGSHWQPLQLDLPVTPVTDLAVVADDLVVATQGRGFWILDDITPLRRLAEGEDADAPYLFPPRSTALFGGGGGFGGSGDEGENPPAGVLVRYLLVGEPAEGEELTAEILDGNGMVLRSFSSLHPERRAPNPWARFMPPDEGPSALPAEAGMNSFSWDLRLPDADLVDDAVLWGRALGPKVPPGTYAVRLKLGDWTATEEMDVLGDPRLDVSRQEYAERFELASDTWRALSECHEALRAARDVRAQVEALLERLGDDPAHTEARRSGEELVDALRSIEGRLHQGRAKAPQDVLNFPPALDNQLLQLQGVVESAAAAPTAGARERYADLRAALDEQLARLDEVLVGPLASFNSALEDLPAVIIPDEGPGGGGSAGGQ